MESLSCPFNDFERRRYETIIVEQFKSFPIEKFIFTKMDETGSIGPMFNLMKKYSIGTAYYTDGQEVPEDLTEADVQKLITLLLEDSTYA